MITNYIADTMTADDAKAFMARANGMDIIVTLVDGSELQGVAISVNSKGVNITANDKVKSVSLKRVASLALDNGTEFVDFLDDLNEVVELDDMDDEPAESDDESDLGFDDDDEVADVECGHTNTTPVKRPIVGGPAAMCDDCGNGVGIHRIPTPAPADADTIEDGAESFTTAEVAAMFAMTAKELRVQLRAMSMGVGQGRRYGLTTEDVAAIRKALTPAS